MEIFRLTLDQMLMMFSLILVGFLLRKKSWLPDNSHITMSKLETFVFTPALVVYAQMTKCTVETFKKDSTLILYGLVLIVAAIGLAYLLARLFVKKGSSADSDYQKNIYRYALTFGNYGFVGNFLVLGVWGDEMYYKYSLFTFFVGVFCHSWGLYVLIPKDKNAGIWKNIRKGLLSPPMVGMVIGMALGLLDFSKYVPDFLLRALDSAGKCQGPVAMVLAGFVIGGYSIKEMLLNKKVYAVSALRLVVIPAVMLLLLKAIGTSDEIMILTLVAFAAPLGLNTIVYPATYGGDTKTGAAMAMISHTLSVITIPLMYLVFIVLL